MIKEAILKLSKKVDLTAGEARSCMNEIMNGEASDVQMSSYLTALSLKERQLTRSLVVRQECENTVSNY